MGTVLSIVQDIAREIGVPIPTSLVSSTTDANRQFLALAQDEVNKLRVYEWPQLSKVFTITLATSTEGYTLPYDFDYTINRTAWDTSNDWELLGPLTAQEWEAVQNGVVSSGLHKKFRIQGFYSSSANVNGDPIPGWRIKIHPVPTSAENGQTLVKEYISTTCILPKQWVTSTAFGANSYCSNVGNIYKTTAGGTTGATPPTHSTGSASDGSVTWVYQSLPYDKFLADTDFPILHHNLVKAGIKWRFLSENGLGFAVAKVEYDGLLMQSLAGIREGRDLNMVSNYDDGLLGFNNIPLDGFGS